MEVLRNKLHQLTTNSNLKIQIENNKLQFDYNYIIPNNNKKYFLYITHSIPVESLGSKTKFNEKSLSLYFCGQGAEPNSFDDFCIEIKSQPSLENLVDILLEGFLYQIDKKLTFQIFDIIYSNSNCLLTKYSYMDRFVLLTEVMYSSACQDLLFKDLNTILTFDIIQPFTSKEDYTFYSKCNKLYRYYTHYMFFSESKRYLEPIEKKELRKTLTITKGSKTEIYLVTNPDTNNNLGILYIPTIEMSQWIKQQFPANSDSINLPCEFNYQFNKWAVRI